MDADRIELFRGLLDNRLQALRQKAGAHIGEMTDARESLSDQTDQATEESDRDLALRMHDHDRRIVREIEAALRRLRNGEYGECMACGEDIGERRLMARPMATHCIDCMTELEIRGRGTPALTF